MRTFGIGFISNACAVHVYACNLASNLWQSRKPTLFIVGLCARVCKCLSTCATFILRSIQLNRIDRRRYRPLFSLYLLLFSLIYLSSEINLMICYHGHKNGDWKPQMRQTHMRTNRTANRIQNKSNRTYVCCCVKDVLLLLLLSTFARPIFNWAFSPHACHSHLPLARHAPSPPPPLPASCSSVDSRIIRQRQRKRAPYA